MGKQISFKEYLASKNVLREAVHTTPKHVAKYTVKKYCKLVVGESKEKKEYVSLKPKQKIFVEWLYENTTNPTILSIAFDGVSDKNTNEKHNSPWRGERLLKWLLKNTHEE